MIKVVSSTLLLALLTLAQSASADVLKLTPLLTFGTNGDGTVRPGERDYLNDGVSSAGALQRGMAWNPVTGHLLVVTRTNPASPTVERVMIMDGTNGETLGQLDLSSLVLGGGNGSFLINLIGVAEDGAIYAANLSNQQTPAESVLYRWDNETAPQTYVFLGDPASGIGGSINRRWGDTLAVRGAGLNTQVLLASRGTVVCIFRPTDASMSSFFATTLQTDVPSGGLGYGLTFGAGDTFWGTSGANGNGPLFHLSFDLNSATATTLQSFPSTNFPGTVSPITVQAGSNWLAGLDTRAGPDLVRLYDVSGLPSAPVLQDRATWFTNHDNGPFSGALAFTTNNILYALDSDNGITAYSIGTVVSNPLAPTIISQPAGRLAQVGSNVVFIAAADGDTPLSYQWYVNRTNAIADATNGSLTIGNAQILNSGNYTFVATNINGAATSSIAVLTVLSNSVDFLVYDAFAYPVGVPLATNIPLGAPFPWTNNNNSASGFISNDNLTISGLAAPIGNSYTWLNSASSMRLPIGTNVSGTLYFSFAFRMDNLGTPPQPTSSETMAGFTTGGGTTFASKVNVVTNGVGGYQLGLYKGGGTTVGALATNLLNVGDVIFLVCRYSFNITSGNDDTCDLWINPDPSTFGTTNPPAPSVAAIGVGANDLPQLDRFFFRRSNGWPLRSTADELRLGYTWAQVTPPFVLPPPTLAVSLVNSTNVLVSWPTNYTDFILQGSTNIAPTAWSTVTNQAVVNGANYNVTVNAANARRFFRLIK